METVIQRQPTLARMDTHVMEISVNLQEFGLMDNDARVLEFVVMLFVTLVCATAEEQFLVTLILTVHQLVKFVTNNLDQFVDFVLLVQMEEQSSLQNVKEILFKHLLQQNQPMLDVTKQSLNTSVQLLARSVLTKESHSLILHTLTIAQL
jgi:hypothetical protein